MWEELLIDSGLNEREVRSILVLGSNSKMKASELAKELGTTRLDAYNSLSRLQEMGIVTVTADRPMRFSSMNVHQAIEHIIGMRKQQLNRLEEGYEEISKDITKESKASLTKTRSSDDPRFAVLKERGNIYSRLKKMAEESEERLILLLGQYGILHLCRNPEALEAVNNAAISGVVCQIITHLDKRTIRFFNELHDSIDVRHSDELESLGFVRDGIEVIQYLNIEDNPVGRGKDDAALIIESPAFAESHVNLIDTIWENAVLFDTAVARYTDNQINDPLRLTIGEGSFLKNFSTVLGIEDELPEEDTPFDPEAFFAAGKEVNLARNKLTEGKLSNLKVLGIDIGLMLRQIGNRIGREVAFSLRGIEHDIEFLDEMMDWWEYAGLGKLSYDLDPEFHIKVELSNQSKDSDSLPLWALDDGIIEGALNEKYNPESGVLIRRLESQNDDEFCRYNLIMSQ